MMLIRSSAEEDFGAILTIVNDAALAYRGVIPADRWHEPYMSADELRSEIDEGVVFWVAEQEGNLAGVMGIQDKGDVALVRHAYVAPTTQRTGVGTTLLRHAESLVDKPILIGTWAAASWADASWADASWSAASWADASWAAASWADASWADASWAEASWADSATEDAAEGDPAGSVPEMSASDFADLQGDPTLALPPALVPTAP